MSKKANNEHITLLVHPKIAVFEWGKVLIDHFNTQSVKSKLSLHTVYHASDIKRYHAPVIILGVDSIWLKNALNALNDIKRWIVLINGIAQNDCEQINHVAADQRIATKKCMDLLCHSGRVKPAFFGVQENDTSDQIKAIAFSELYSHDDVYQIKDGNVKECADRLLGRIDDYDSVICANDVMAIYLLSRCRQSHIEIPKELHLIGNGNLWLSSHVTPAVTTVSYNAEATARIVLQICNDLCEFEDLDPVRIHLGAHIVQRESTGAHPNTEDLSIYRHGAYVGLDNEALCDELSQIVTLDRVLSSCSPKKREILQLWTAGASVDRIAEQVFLSQDAVKYHIKKLYKLLGIHAKKDLLEIIDAYGIKL